MSLSVTGDRFHVNLPVCPIWENVRQLIDSLQVRSGNPELKIFTVYKNELEADFRKGLFSGNVHLSYQYQHRPIMEETIRDKNNSFVRTNANQLSWQKLNPELELKLGPLKDILTFSFFYRYKLL